MNQPEINGAQPYWVVGKPEYYCSPSQKATKEDFKSWADTYGFLVDANDVSAIPKRKKSI